MPKILPLRRRLSGGGGVGGGLASSGDGHELDEIFNVGHHTDYHEAEADAEVPDVLRGQRSEPGEDERRVETHMTPGSDMSLMKFFNVGHQTGHHAAEADDEVPDVLRGRRSEPGEDERRVETHMTPRSDMSLMEFLMLAIKLITTKPRPTTRFPMSCAAGGLSPGKMSVDNAAIDNVSA
jgi:hypothetical protein